MKVIEHPSIKHQSAEAYVVWHVTVSFWSSVLIAKSLEELLSYRNKFNFSIQPISSHKNLLSYVEWFHIVEWKHYVDAARRNILEIID